MRDLRERARQRKALDVTWRLTVLMVGIAVILAGLAGLVLPVLPGWALIFVGVGVLATEFAWAERLLDRVKEKVTAVADKTMPPARRRRTIAIVSVVLCLTLAAGIAYYLRYGFALPL